MVKKTKQEAKNGTREGRGKRGGKVGREKKNIIKL